MIYRLTILLLIFGCKDENPELENFRGITEIDVDGNLISEDSDDWYGNEYRNTHCITDTPSEDTESEETSMQSESLPETYKFIPAFPNPFDTLVSVHYGLPTNSQVNLRIIDKNGNKIIQILNENQNEGFHCVSWDGKDENGEALDSALYRILFYAGDFFSHGDILYSP